MRTAGMVAVLVLATGCAGPSTRVTSAPTATDQPTVAPRVALDRLPHGPAPRIGYTDGLTFVRPDGSRVRLAVPEGVTGLTAARAVGDGFLVADDRIFEGTVGLFLTHGGRVEEFGDCANSGGAATRDGRRAAWATGECTESGIPAPTVITRQVDGERRSQTFPVPRGVNPVVSVVGLVDHAVVFQPLFGTGGVWVTDLASPARQVDGLRSAGGVDEGSGRIAGQSPGAKRWEDGPAVVTDAAGRVSWRRPGVRLADFSPDGRLVLAGQGDRWLVLDAATGAVRERLVRPPGTAYAQPVWEDDDHLLVVAAPRGRQAVVRIGLDGSLETATPVVRRGRAASLVPTAP